MFINLASLELDRGDVTGAASDFRVALARRPDQPFAMLGLGGALIRQRNWEEARQWVQRCEEIPLVRSSALVDQAVLEYQESGRDRLDLLREAAALQPHCWPTRKRYIEHLTERGDTAEALRELQAVLKDQPFRADTWSVLAELSEKTGNSPLAERAFDQAAWLDVHLNPNFRGYELKKGFFSHIF